MCCPCSHLLEIRQNNAAHVGSLYVACIVNVNLHLYVQCVHVSLVFMSGKSQTIRDFTVPDFADVSENCQMLVLDSPDSDFGGKWKVYQKLKHAI